jgi:hypothetical protein
VSRRAARMVAIAVAALVLAFAVARALRARRQGGASPGPASSAPAPAAGPCDRYRGGNTKVRWACFSNGAPIDVVTEQSMIVTVLHLPVRVLVLDSEPLDPTVPIANPKNPPIRICVLDQPGAGFSGFVSSFALHEQPCRK